MKPVADLTLCNRGDRVRLADGRLVELGFPVWAHGVLAAEQKKTPPVGWFAREIVVDDWTGVEQRVDLPRMLDLNTPAVAIEREGKQPSAVIDMGDHGDALDPLGASAPRSCNPNQGGLW